MAGGSLAEENCPQKLAALVEHAARAAPAAQLGDVVAECGAFGPRSCRPLPGSRAVSSAMLGAMRLLGLPVVCALLVVTVSGVTAQPVLEENMYQACSIFATVLREGREGIATGPELRAKIQEMYVPASMSKSEELRRAATALLRAATDRQGVAEAAKAMTAACLDHPRFRGLNLRSSTPITEDQAERQLRGALERSGEKPTNCRQKQYGSGWVTVCD
jgi:hypothetical protein